MRNERQGIIQKYSKTEKASEDHYRWRNRAFSVCAQGSNVPLHLGVVAPASNLSTWKDKGTRAARGTESPNTVQTGWRNPISNGKINLIN